MATVFIPPPLRAAAEGNPQVEVTGSTLRQVVRELDEKFPGLADRLCADDDLAPGLAVSVDGHLSTQGLLTRIGPESEVHFLPAVGGG